MEKKFALNLPDYPGYEQIVEGYEQIVELQRLNSSAL